MAEDWARQIGLDRRSQQIILLARRACPIWPARTRQNPRNPKSTGRKSKVPGLAARAHLQASGGGLVNIRASIVLQSSAILGSNAMLPYAE